MPPESLGRRLIRILSLFLLAHALLLYLTLQDCLWQSDFDPHHFSVSRMALLFLTFPFCLLYPSGAGSMLLALAICVADVLIALRIRFSYLQPQPNVGDGQRLDDDDAAVP